MTPVLLTPGPPVESPRPLPALPGGGLDASGVVGRDDTILWSLQRLGEGSSLLLNEPRRFGKTLLLHRMAAATPAGMHAVHQSFQGVDTRAEMVARALHGIAGHRRLTTRAKQKAGAYLNRVAGIGAVTLSPAMAQNPTDALEQAFTDVDGSLAGGMLVLLWDEVPDMVESIAEGEGPAAAVQTLAVLRRLRRPESGIRWVFTGSVGFHHVLPLVGADSTVLNDMQNLTLGPLDEAWTRWLAESLLLGVTERPDPEAVAQLAAVTGGIPYLLHLVAAHLRDHAVGAVTATAVDRAFDRCIDDLDESQGVTHFLTRVGKYYGSRERLARGVLDTLVDEAMTRTDLLATVTSRVDDEELRAVLQLLRLDHYLVRSDDVDPVYSWRYPVLARIWRQRRR